MIQATENVTGYTPDELLGIAARENNDRRRYLLVNRFQAKHVPVSPSKALELFDTLGKRLYSEMAGERVAFIGFAETATAIGAHIACGFPGDGWYLQTTREAMDTAFLLADFSEEHSHATLQRLFCADVQMLKQADRIVFVEDELTTGKTILNLVEALRRQGLTDRFHAASVVNCMEPEHLDCFAERGIQLSWLMRLSNTSSGFSRQGNHLPELPQIKNAVHPRLVELHGRPEPRIGLRAGEYQARCELLAGQVADAHAPVRSDRLLVLGTEECMYPAIFCGAFLEAAGCDVQVHATTRSPILVGGAGNPLVSRVNLRSFYQAERNTCLYNLAAYEQVLVITDALPFCQEGLDDLASALGRFGCRQMTMVRWVP